MKQYLILLFSFCILSCTNQEPVQQQITEKIIEEQVDSTPVIVEEIIEEEPLPPPAPTYNPKKKSKALKRLLANPIDLAAFKKKNDANSGVSQGESYFYRPEGKGFYYYYFVFKGCSPHGLRVEVYKFGEEAGSYSDTNEELIEIRGSCEHKDLRKINFNAQTWEEVQAKYGTNCMQKDQIRIYEDKGNLLILRLANNLNSIMSFRYIRTKIKSIKSIDDIPSELLAG